MAYILMEGMIPADVKKGKIPVIHGFQEINYLLKYKNWWVVFDATVPLVDETCFVQNAN